LLVTLPGYQLKADGPDVFRNFVVAIPGDAAGYVRGMQFRPGSPGVHHANIRVDRTTASRQLDDADPAPGYEGVIARTADYPDGQFLGWTPGQLAPTLADDAAWRIQGGSDLVVQLHLRPTGRIETIAPTIGFFLGTRAPSRTPTMIRLGRQDLDIPANASGHTVSDTFTLPVAVDLRAVQPHAHYRARSLQAWAIRSDGARTPLLRIDDWDVNWQDRYTFAKPMRLEAGTTLRVDYTFDNSVGNPRNPDRPPQRSRWGWRSSDEMADLWLQVVADSDADRTRLGSAVERKMLAADAVGTEVLLAREPNHVNLRNDAAGIYLALGRPGDALRHFEAVRTLLPGSAPAQFNVGVALEALGRLDEALTRYTDALTIDSRYSAAYNNSGGVLLRQGQLASARSAFEHAITADSANADAYANLGLVMIGAGQSDAALAQLQKALELKPALLTGLVPHVWLLCANADASARRPEEGRSLAERMARETFNQDAASLDALAMCQAAMGSFAEAIATATAADPAVPRGATELRDGIRRRLALYRAGQRFVLPQ
ncbi:MAG TPA: tetratricopeptide repeat protein, partial [Vicinamibacterales bacterium]